ncbi:MAG: TonB-dependent receptor [Bacteroidia bacterium]|nr:TonB-dependent receptor [Bacteroidia bacterium]MDW8301180.1 carboxypeptidase-like regulatory domain-containing protein [Bacteroidia bacterium]
MNRYVKTTFLWFVAILTSVISVPRVYAQGGVGKLKGVLKDAKTKEGLPFVSIIVEQGGIQKGGTTTDIEGNYEITPLMPGEYTLKAVFVGYKSIEATKIQIAPAKTTFLNLEMEPDDGVTTQTVVVETEAPIIEKDKTSLGGTLSREQIINLPTRNIADAAGLAGGTFQRDDGKGLNIAGQRSTGSVFFIDGMKVVGSINLPQQAIGSLNIITGGVPAMYGDAVGGVINITTRGAAQEFSVTGEAVTSKFLDPYNYNLGGLTFIGPLLKTTAKDKNGEPIRSATDTTQYLKKTVLGYMLAAEIEYQKDRFPSRVPIWQVKEEKLNEIRERPYRYNDDKSALLYNAEFLTKNDMYTQKFKPNNRALRYTINGKLDYQPTEFINITAGANYDYTRDQLWQATRSLFASEANRISNRYTYRGFVRFTQRFADAPPDSTTKNRAGKYVDKRLKNVYYQVQLDYTASQERQYDPRHKYRLFDYGYVGKFEQKFRPIYAYNTDYFFSEHPFNDTLSFTAFYDNVGYTFTNPVFTPGTQNPYLVKYTQLAYQLEKDRGDSIYTLAELAALRGLRNGDFPQNIYGLYSPPGTVHNLARYVDDRQLRFTAMGSGEYRGHNITAGLELEQRNQSFWAISPVGLWSLMRQKANAHLQRPDSSSIELVRDANGVWTGYVNHKPLYNAAAQTDFDKKLRQKLGMPINSTEWINTDALDPSFYSLDLFTTNELLNNGNNFITYYGYDHLGRRYRGKQPTFSDFFKDTVNRPISAFRPIYIAGFIQDKFEINNLIMNVGLRVDRFDANQKVLKNPFVLYEYYTAGEVRAMNNPALVVPDNVKDDWTVYINNPTNPTAIVGFSDPKSHPVYPKFYDANGVEKLPNLIFGTNGRAYPYLKNGDKLTEGAFVDYKPQVNIMPRLAFSFPITEQAVFFAHYDVLTQRPASTNLIISPLATTPVDYLYLVANATQSINNPNLRADRTIDYALGFKTALNKKMALTINGYYRELRDQINIVNRSYAYPINYTTYENIDFGTVKGFTFEYEKRPGENSNLQLNVIYTLQFADGTGSNDRSAASLVNSGQPNLRTPLPLDFDQRHALVVTADYRYGRGEFYNGPEKLRKVLQDFGVNLTLRAGSGTPYSRILFPIRTVDASAVQRTTLVGNPNSARMPANFRANVRIDKDFQIKVGGGEKGSKTLNLNVYLQIQNVLNNKNIQSVYQFTGQPDDDGYLNHAVAQTFLQQQTNAASYRDLYSIRVNHPDNYGLPRRTRLGVIISF